MLCGILAVNPTREGWWGKLFEERLYLGNVMGSMEGWLGVRSLRTLELRVERQSQTATKLVAWLNAALNSEKESDGDTKAIKDVLASIEHASLQAEDIENGWLLKQMPNGFGPVFSITMKEQAFARRLPSKLQLFHHATSLGGVESLIEWRTMTDSGVDTRLLRVSIGVEGFEDLRDDLLQAFKALSAESQEELKT